MGRKKRGPIDQFTGLDLPAKKLQKIRKESQNICTHLCCKKKATPGFKQCPFHRKKSAMASRRYRRRHPGCRKKEHARESARIMARYHILRKRGFSRDESVRRAVTTKPINSFVFVPPESTGNSDLN
jgi:hypothetical protein